MESPPAEAEQFYRSAGGDIDLFTSASHALTSISHIFQVNCYPQFNMTDPSPSEALSQLQRLEKEHGDIKTHLSIVRISEPISLESETEHPSPSKRGSDISALDNPTPSLLEADLTHYKVCNWTDWHTGSRGTGILTDIFIGTFLKITLFIRRTSYKRKVPSRNRGRSAPRRRPQ